MTGITLFIGNQIQKYKLEKDNVEKDNDISEIAEEKLYSDEVRFCVKSIIALKNTLKDPDSLKIHYLYYDNRFRKKSVHMEISAKNSYGGMDRTIYTIAQDDNVYKAAVLGSYDSHTKLYVFENVFPIEIIIDNTNIYMNDIFELLTQYEMSKNNELIEILSIYDKDVIQNDEEQLIFDCFIDATLHIGLVPPRILEISDIITLNENSEHSVIEMVVIKSQWDNGNPPQIFNLYLNDSEYIKGNALGKSGIYKSKGTMIISTSDEVNIEDTITNPSQTIDIEKINNIAKILLNNTEKAIQEFLDTQKRLQ